MVTKFSEFSSLTPNSNARVLRLLWSFGSVHLGVQKEAFGAFFIVYI